MEKNHLSREINCLTLINREENFCLKLNLLFGNSYVIRRLHKDSTYKCVNVWEIWDDERDIKAYTKEDWRMNEITKFNQPRIMVNKIIHPA